MDPEHPPQVSLENVTAILNTTHHKFLTGISISGYLKKKLVFADKKNSTVPKSSTFEARAEVEIGLEQEAKQLGVKFSMTRGEIDDTTLSTLSSVADLLIINEKVLQQLLRQGILSELMESIVCPILTLPMNGHIARLVMVQDGTLSSVHAVKHFLRLFRRELRSLPAHVLVSEPENRKDIQGEKVFIDYIKMFFNDLGIQLMCDHLVNSLTKNIKDIPEPPLVIVGESGGCQMLNSSKKNPILDGEIPTLIFKNAHSF